ncbi:hypothetical protein A9G37_11895 [Gilliamella sp. GillExp13]|nr:hypothetical protein A9G37_11895 [Gilliamella apicola]
MAFDVVADSACDSKEYDNNNNGANANGIFENSFVNNFDNNQRNNLDNINEIRVKTRRIKLFDKFKT